MKLAHYCNKIIEYSFYGIFLFVPILFSQYTSELFELNKIWTLYFFTIIITGAWLTKMAAEKRLYIRRSLFDIPLLLFLLSQIISTIFSLDQHVSFYGYYSRFNGGLLSTITYIFLYYAFVSNLNLKELWRGLGVTLWTGVFVALWGFPSHYGADPTCLLFRGTLDTSCWTDAFHPTVRIFSTLGQPAWLAAYLAFLIPLTLGYLLKHDPEVKNPKANMGWYVTYICIALLFFADLVFANTRAGYIGFLFGYITFWMLVWFPKLKKTPQIIIVFGYSIANLALLYATAKNNFLLMAIGFFSFLMLLFLIKRVYLRTFLTINILFIVMTFMLGTPMGRIPLPSFGASQPQAAVPSEKQQQAAGTVLETNITDSGNIREIVWKGAIDIWKAHPLFGSGVETYAFAYYKHRPAAHNMTSEWDFLYNKAHNEYLNYLATTGAFGLLTYLLIIGGICFVVGKILFDFYQHKQPEDKKEKEVQQHMLTEHYPVVAGIFAGFVTILISNFFGFSVVIINLFLFLTPAFLLMLLNFRERAIDVRFGKATDYLNPYQWTYITVIIIVSVYFLLTTFRTWQADKAYALGYNLNRVGDFQNAYMKLSEAVKLRPAEPVFKDEFSVTNATIASALYEQKDMTNAQQFASQAVSLTNEVTTQHPNNIIFWKDRFKVFYLLASVDSPERDVYRQEAINSLKQAIVLAPTDAKAMFNLGLVYRDANDLDNAIAMFQKAIELKPDYRDSYYALGMAYHAKAVGPNGVIVDQDAQQKAVDIMHTILDKFNKNDAEALKALNDWNVQAASESAKPIPVKK